MQRDKNVFNFNCNHIDQGQKCDNWQVSSSPTEQTEYQHELEKAHLVIEQQKTEIEYLKQQVSDLRDMINLLKKPE